MTIEYILVLLFCSGALTFISSGLCFSHSVETKDSDKNINILKLIVVIGFVCFLIGFVGLLINNFLK